MDRLARILQRDAQPRVVVAGDVILDEYLHGSVERLSPEAPVPVLTSSRSTHALGGAANVAHNLRQLGCDVTLAGVVGEDQAGKLLRQLLQSAGINDRLVVDPQRPTTHKTRVISRDQQMLRIDREVDGPLSPGVVEELEAATAEALRGAAGLIVSDYRKGALTAQSLPALFNAARDAGAMVMVDPKGLDYGRYRGASLLTPNLHELGTATGFELSGHDDPKLATATAELLDVTGADAVLVTCGKAGMVLCRPGGAPVHIPAQAREVYDITGAGDTVIAALGFAAFGGTELEDAARFANVAASVVVAKFGTSTVTRDELALRLTGSTQRRGKVLSLDALAAVVDEARARGNRIVCTNGCFELLHAGHVAYLQAARARGDVLIVALNSDDSVRRLKGPARPLVPQAERAAVLAALDCVSYVTVFSQDTPAALVRTLNPDVLVKGADYSPEQIAGADFVESQGGRVEVIPLVPGTSTSRIIDTVLERYGQEDDPQENQDRET